MRLMRLFPLLALASVLLSGVSETAASAQESATPTVRILNRIDEGDLVPLRGNTHPAANASNDRGPVSPSLPMTDLILVLSRDKAQQAAFDKFVASQYDSASPNFHQWLTPEQVGTNFGPSETDITTITHWLTGHGFTLTQITKDRLSIRFNGTAAQVESAFHTQIHNLSVRGVPHVANMTDPELPAALSSVVVGVKALHNFFPRPLHRVGSPVTRDRATGKWVRSAEPVTTALRAKAPLTAAPSAHAGSPIAAPQFGISVGGAEPYLAEDVGPYDFATIYNVLPLWNAKTPIDGTGQTIAIAGTSDIEVGQATTETGASGANDIATFRTFFGLPTGSAVNTPIRISGNSEPLTVCSSTTSTVCGTSDLLENTLDVEWSASVAKNAQIVLVASYPASTTDDNLYDSESYIVNNLTARIMNVSYGECELGNGTAGNVQYYDLWQTAASEGIAVFVAAGDSGSASCDQGGDEGGNNLPYPAEFGLTVSGLASTPYDTAVGGTDFNWCSLTATECTAAPYWSSTNNASAGQSSALGYLPEVPWNDTCTNPLALQFMENFWQGAATVTDAEQACNAFTVNALTLSNDGDGTLLYLVDTVGGGGGASSCVVNTTTSTSTTLGACTSSATSTGATSNPDTGAAQGSLTVVKNGWPKPSWQTGVSGIPADGVRDLPDVSFFASDGFLSGSAYVVCASDLAPCSFSSKGVPTFVEVGGTSVATPTMAGVMGLIDEKIGAAQGNANAELYALAAKQTYSNCSAERGSGAPVTTGSCLFNDIDTGTNAMACDYNDPVGVTLPTPNCTVLHSGDVIGVLPGYSAAAGYDQATGLGSLNVANVVNAWTAVALGTSTATVTVTPAPTTLPISEILPVTVSVAGPKTNVTSNGTAVVPTGTVTLTAGTFTSQASALSSSGTSVVLVPANSLSVGTNSISVSYSGDVLYGAAAGSASVTGTVAAVLTPVVTVTPASSGVNSGASLSVQASVTGSGTSAPTGAVTLVGDGYNSGIQMLSNGAFTFNIPANVLSTGTATLTLTYFGDQNYLSGTNTATVTVGESTFTLTPTTPAAIAPGASAMSTITVKAVSGYTGTVTLTCQEEADASPTTGDGASCSIPTTAVAMGATAVATVTTTAASTTVSRLASPRFGGKRRGWEGAGGGAVLALLWFVGVPARRRKWQSIVGVLFLTMALGSLAACGGGGGGGGGTGGGGGGTTTDPGTAAGTYTFTVVATGNPSVNPPVQTTFTVTVQ
jgi:Pro-kumamolisin, activation domain/Bacterial Ig-like domain (group 3)